MTSDLGAIRTRLEQQRKLVGGELTEADVRKILRSRAEALAARREDEEPRRHLLDVVVARRAKVLWGFPCERLAEIRSVEVARLPFVPSSVCGLTQIRGRLHPVVDLQPAARGASDLLGHGDRCLAAVLTGPSGTLGVRIDEVAEVRSILEGDLCPPPEDSPDEIVSHLTRDVVHIIDVDALFQSRSVVHSPEENQQ